MTDNNAPPYLSSLLPPKVGDLRPSSRNAANYTPIKCRLELYKNSFLPSALNLYNSIDLECRTLAHTKDKFEPNILYNYGERAINIICAQLRMKCSNLKGHLYCLHVIDSPMCACGHDMEDCNHYLLHCPLYHIERNIMFNSLLNLIPREQIKVEILLHGSEHHPLCTNLKIIHSLQMYIKESARF